MNFTAKQTDAINTHNVNLLISAGAGSGKTTVLTERLIRRIKNGDSVTDFLVVTFMKAAASDIKQKLYKALIEEIAKNPNDKHLFRQSTLVSEANICTISSYCLSLVKENFALLGISPRVRVIDETESAMMLRNAADKIISEGYETDDKNLLLLADNFSGIKNDEPLSDAMIELYNALRVMLSREEMLINCANELRNDAKTVRENGFFETERGKTMQTRLRVFYDELLESANDIYSFAVTSATDDKYLQPLDELLKSCEAVRISVDTNYVNFCSTAESSLATIRLSNKGCDAEAHKIIKDMKEALVKTEKSLYERYCRGSEALISESFEKCADIIDAIRDFINKLDSEYELSKLENGVLDYTDFEQKALKLLEVKDEFGNSVPSELALKKQNSFKEILIDEYQDVNPMQDRIFNLLSNGNNRFMVGDVKQSIYRFRNAYPDIFLGYKEQFQDLSGNTEKGARIFLRENFRCSQTVIDFVNRLFESVTKNTPYYREYEDEWLIHASTAPDRHHPVIVAISDKEKDMAKESRQAEAEYIAKEILRLVNNETSDNGEKLKFSDVAVMLSAMKGYSIDYEKAFQKYGIPYKNEKSENFLENPDIRLALSALKAIDDPNDDISLCSLMRSPVCNFTSDDLYRIRENLPSMPFFDAVASTALPTRKREYKGKYRATKRIGNHCLAVRCKNFIKTLYEWRKKSSGVPCKEFLKDFLVSSGLLQISTVSASRQSLLLLYEYSQKYESASNQGLSGFLDYIKELSKTGKQIADVAKTGEEDAVSFITVHKSKGLEYKVCFVAGADKKFGGKKNKTPLTVLRRKGIFFKLKNKNEFVSYDPICNILAEDEEKEHLLGEELRKLYVALTRAKERLYITGCADEGWENKRYYPSSCKSWLEFAIYVASLGEKSFFDVVHIGETDTESGYIPKNKGISISPSRKMLDIVDFVYPHQISVTTARKISVSELREGLLEDDEYNRSITVPSSRVAIKPVFAGETKSDASDIGTANHLFMQFCDFDRIDSFGVEKEADRLTEIRMISEKQKELLDIKSLSDFFKTDLYSRIRNSKSVYREKRFSVSDVFKENGEKVLVQGVIDCFFENPDGTYSVVDYKTDRVFEESDLINRHKLQLSCYKSAVERMTGREVKNVIIYSFALGKEVSVIEQI